MDIVYVVGTGSNHNNIELRWSLRSICKYAKGIGKVIVAGYPPDWLSDDVVKVPVQDKYSFKHSNIFRCLEEVVAQGHVTGDFLYSSDDHFYVRMCDFNHYPYYRKSMKLRTSVPIGDRFRKYHTSLMDTGTLLRKHGYPDANYAQHANTHMHAGVIRDSLDIIHESYGYEFGAEPTSLLMNIWQTRPDAPPITDRKDVKICRAYTRADIIAQIGDRECFSIGDSLFGRIDLETLMNSEFAEICRYEKNSGNPFVDA